ncbi:predicted protein [Histoplasma capsulatum G186AR]|uniref:Uncharacterized protein n=1 Tax=Ajellomyces capsulatus (strain G186AR / H82 / ATCC MYA-2454 / RMSCC 2432) TaxID=447093 RepID=C0NSZ0_AJECG|nr:uncharacterized protein HCBG_06270 [Histoplasma capsulatum G186AR]EEH05151.1 predicted protein [Histoplasma capsulatum G186AR]
MGVKHPPPPPTTPPNTPFFFSGIPLPACYVNPVPTARIQERECRIPPVSGSWLILCRTSLKGAAVREPTGGRALIACMGATIAADSRVGGSQPSFFFFFFFFDITLRGQTRNRPISTLEESSCWKAGGIQGSLDSLPTEGSGITPAVCWRWLAILELAQAPQRPTTGWKGPLPLRLSVREEVGAGKTPLGGNQRPSQSREVRKAIRSKQSEMEESNRPCGSVPVLNRANHHALLHPWMLKRAHSRPDKKDQPLPGQVPPSIKPWGGSRQLPGFPRLPPVLPWLPRDPPRTGEGKKLNVRQTIDDNNNNNQQQKPPQKQTGLSIARGGAQPRPDTCRQNAPSCLSFSSRKSNALRLVDVAGNRIAAAARDGEYSRVRTRGRCAFICVFRFSRWIVRGDRSCHPAWLKAMKEWTSLLVISEFLPHVIRKTAQKSKTPSTNSSLNTDLRGYPLLQGPWIWMLTPESTKVFESCARTAHTDSRDLSPSHQNPCYRLRSRSLSGFNGMMFLEVAFEE